MSAATELRCEAVLYRKRTLEENPKTPRLALPLRRVQRGLSRSCAKPWRRVGQRATLAHSNMADAKTNAAASVLELLWATKSE